MQKGTRTFSGMLARLRQKALRFPCVDPEPSPCLSPYTPRHSHRRASEGLYCREAKGVEETESYRGSSLGVKLACCRVGSMPNPSRSGSLGTPRHSHRQVVEGSRLSGGKRTAEVLG